MGKTEESIVGCFTDFWSEERKMAGFLSALIVDTLMLYPLVSAVSSSVAIQIINILVTLAVFIFGLFALTHHNITRMVFGGALIIVISVLLARFAFGAHWLLGWDMLLELLIVIVYLCLILKYVYKKGPVTRQRIEGAVAAYLLITIAFALGHMLISFLMPGAYIFPDKELRIDDPRFGYIFHYFSISTITTLGFGDILPVHPFSRTLATIEALVGQLYPAILLARLVSLSVVDSRRSDKQKTITRQPPV